MQETPSATGPAHRTPSIPKNGGKTKITHCKIVIKFIATTENSSNLTWKNLKT